MKKELAFRAGVREEDLPAVPPTALETPDSNRYRICPSSPRPVMAIDQKKLTERPALHAAFFEEHEERLLTGIEKFESENQEMEAKIKCIVEGIGLLTEMHEDFKALLGFNDEQASRLVPDYLDPERPE